MTGSTVIRGPSIEIGGVPFTTVALKVGVQRPTASPLTVPTQRPSLVVPVSSARSTRMPATSTQTSAASRRGGVVE
jgi:hypothetical protein